MSHTEAAPVPDAEPASPAPRWFEAALAACAEHGSVIVDGTRIDYRSWGPSGSPGIVLLHGSAAHAGWWDHIGPQLADPARVIAISLSGHGTSGHRPRYTNAGWANEVAAIIATEGLRAPTIVAHSMSGQVAATLASRSDAPALNGVIFVDWIPRASSEQKVREQRARANRTYRPRPDLANAIATFRPRPAQPTALPYVFEHIARQSFRAADDGWRLAFDRKIYDRRPFLLEDVRRFFCRCVLMRADHGTMSPSEVSAFAAKLESPFAIVELPDAHHHVMIDRPLVLVAALRTQLAAWAADDTAAATTESRRH